MGFSVIYYWIFENWSLNFVLFHKRMLRWRREAEIAIELMKEAYRRIVEEEENRRGLIITKSVYGKWIDLSNRDLSDAFTDVTIPLQCLVKDSKLILHEASKVPPYIIDSCCDSQGFF